jgi:hypothetical protein
MGGPAGLDQATLVRARAWLRRSPEGRFGGLRVIGGIR